MFREKKKPRLVKAQPQLLRVRPLRSAQRPREETQGTSQERVDCRAVVCLREGTVCSGEEHSILDFVLSCWHGDDKKQTGSELRDSFFCLSASVPLCSLYLEQTVPSACQCSACLSREGH